MSKCSYALSLQRLVGLKRRSPDCHLNIFCLASLPPLCWLSVFDVIPANLTFSQFNHSVMSDALQPHGLQHARHPCPSATPGVYPNSCPSNHLIFCCPLLLPPSILPNIRVFPMNQFFTSSGQSIGVSVSTSVLPMNVEDWFPLGLTGFISLQSKGCSKSLVHYHSLKASIPQCSAFFMVQFSHPYMTTGKTIALTMWTFACSDASAF